MFRKKQSKINYTRIADFVAPQKKTSAKKKVLLVGLGAAAVATAAGAYITKESDQQ